jgi:hypothetical protein
MGNAPEQNFALDLQDELVIRRNFLAEFADFREQRAEVTVQPARELRLIRLTKLVKLPPRILQVTQGFLVIFLKLLPGCNAIHPHQRAAAVDGMSGRNGMAVGR